MRRRRRVKPSGGVQMFSFLDAMICTMGALLVLLHAFARHGQIEIAEKAEARSSEAEIKSQREDVAWRIEHLKQSRVQTEAELADARLKLSHVEDHERRLRERLRELKIAADEMERLASTDAGARRQALTELAAVQDKVREAQQAVQEARQKSGRASPAYSVVPYEGPHTTRRRPIYIECRADAVILQPEGIELAAEDFAGLMGPGNPLASALRGMSEYLARHAADKGAAGEPYPLLLVRPDGIEAYYAARSALVSWGSDFGYELVGSDWKLKFPEPDPGLTDLARQVVAEARQRHREYLATASQIVRSRSRPTYHASSRGGFAPNPGSPGGRGGSRSGGWESLGTDWSRRGGNGVGGPNDEGRGGQPKGTSGSGDSLAGKAGLDTPTGGGSSESGEASGRGQTGMGTGSQGAADGAGQGSGGPGSFDGNKGELAAEGSGHAGSDAAGNRNQQSFASEAGERGSASTRGNAKGQNAFAAGSSTAPGASATGSTSGSQGSAGGQNASSEMGQTPPSSMGMSSQSKKVNSMAKARGRDWGLPEAAPAAIAATRPIRVECHNDHLVIVPEAKNEPKREIRLGPKTQDSMDELVSNVWQHMKGWGVAGKGLYWRPTLVMDVKPGAADRYAEIKSLLADSGLDVHERQPPPTASSPARKTTR